MEEACPTQPQQSFSVFGYLITAKTTKTKRAGFSRHHFKRHVLVQIRPKQYPSQDVSLLRQLICLTVGLPDTECSRLLTSAGRHPSRLTGASHFITHKSVKLDAWICSFSVVTTHSNTCVPRWGLVAISLHQSHRFYLSDVSKECVLYSQNGEQQCAWHRCKGSRGEEVLTNTGFDLSRALELPWTNQVFNLKIHQISLEK